MNKYYKNGKRTENFYKYQNQWTKEHKTQITLKFDKVKDADVIEYLKAKDNVTDYVRQMIKLELMFDNFKLNNTVEIIDPERDELFATQDELKETKEAYEILFKDYHELLRKYEELTGGNK